MLCQRFPAEFTMYLNYCRGLRFEETPDYMYLRQLFRILFRTLNHQFDYTFDWTMLKQRAVMPSSNSNFANGATAANQTAAAAMPIFVNPGPSATNMTMPSQAALKTGGPNNNVAGAGLYSSADPSSSQFNLTHSGAVPLPIKKPGGGY